MGYGVPPRPAILDRVLVDYELFGRRWTQPVPLIPAPALDCGLNYGVAP